MSINGIESGGYFLKFSSFLFIGTEMVMHELRYDDVMHSRVT